MGHFYVLADLNISKPYRKIMSMFYCFNETSRSYFKYPSFFMDCLSFFLWRQSIIYTFFYIDINTHKE